MQQDRAAIIDEFGELQRQIRLFAPTVQRSRVLTRIIENWYIGSDPELSFEADGRYYHISVGPRSRKRHVDCRRLYAVIGEKFWEDAEYPFKVFDTLPIDTLDLVTEERSGSRTIDAVLRAAVAVAPVETETKTEPQPKTEPRQPPPRKPRGGKPTKRAAGSAHARGEARA